MSALSRRPHLFQESFFAGRLLFVVLLASCSQPNSWTKPGITETGFDADIAACRQQASRNTQSISFTDTGGLERFDMQEGLIQRCMEGKGYRLQR